MTHKEGNENRGIHHDQGQDGRPAITETVSDGSSQEYTDEGTTLAGLEESTLPSSWNGEIKSIRPGDGDTIPSLESGQGDKVAIQKHVKGLHDLPEHQSLSARRAGINAGIVLRW
jgi:hypothetical protein